ncbi:MAG: recombinase family protein [Oscillospiraceae bacterium]|nr:recombinase family protein [Oscillospiraceae bacterium]
MAEYAYVRVSTKEQNIDRQLAALKPYNIPRKNIYCDYQSGKDFDRPAYQKMLKRLKPGDLLILKSVDRLGRNYNEILVQWQNITKDIGDALREKIVPGFEDYGLTIPQFFLTNIVLPESDPNFKRLRELHTIALQKKMAAAEAEVRTSQAQSRASYMTAEAEAEAKIKVAQRGAILESQTTETEIARRDAERRLIQAQTEAQAAQMSLL